MEGDQFWSTVLKNYSDAFEEVIKLKQRLQVLQEQCDEQCTRANILQEENKQLVTLPQPVVSISSTTSLSDEQRMEALAKLREAEMGLEKARHEYAKLKEKQHASEAKITAFKIQNATLLQEKSQLLLQRDSLSENAIKLQATLDGTKRENDELKEQLNEVTELRLQNAVLKSKILHKQNENLQGPCDDDLKAKILCQEKEIQELKRSAQADNDLNVNLRAELASARESLQKSKDAQKTLVATITQLQNMVRNVPVPAQPNTTNVASSISNAPSSTPAGPTRISLATSMAGSSTPAPGRIPFPTSKPLDIKPVLDLSHNDDVTIVEEHSSQICPAYVTPVPKARRDAFATLPPIISDIVDDSSMRMSFTRNLLASALGGSVQPLIVKVSRSQTGFSRGRGISCYLCPNLDHNPWCPSTPGQHGYIFVGLGGERDTFSEPEIHNMFVGTKETSRSQRLMSYVGIYRAVRVDPLSKQEWSTLSSDVKRTYCETTKERAKDARPRAVELIHSEYDDGQLRVPCVRVQCIGFDKELYTHLIAAQGTPATVSGSRSPGKRRRDDHDDHGEDFEASTRKRCGRKSH